MVNTEENNVSELRALLDKAQGQLNRNNLKTQEYAKKALLLALEMEEERSAVEAYTLTAQGQMLAGEFAAAEISIASGLKLSEKIEDKFLAKRLRIYSGILMRMQGQYAKAVEILSRESRNAEIRFQATIFNNLGMIYDVQGEREKALKSFTDSRLIHERLGNKEYAAGLLTNEAGVLFKLDRIKEAKAKLFSALERIEGLGDNPLAKMFVFIDLGRINLKEKKVEEAIENFKLAKALCEDNHFHQFYHDILSDLAKAYHHYGENDKAEELYLKALSTDSATNKREVLERLHPFYKELGEIEKAYEYQNQLIEVLKEVNKENQKASITSLKNQFEVIEKQKEIDRLRVENVLNKEIVSKARRIEQQNEELRQFSYAISHDLKAPLRSIKGFAQLLKDKFQKDLPDEGSKYLNHIIDGTERMHSLIRDIYTYASFDSNNKETVDVRLSKVFENVKHNLSALIQESKARVTAEALPKISAYSGQMEQVFQNLIQNAITYSRPDLPPEIRILFLPPDEEGFFQLIVEDNGMGIEKRFHDSVFKLFTRIDRQKGEGTGLGLAICSKIINQMDGKIWLESIPNDGTKVHIALPSIILLEQS